MKQHRKKIIFAEILTLLLFFSYFLSENTVVENKEIKTEIATEETASPTVKEEGIVSAEDEIPTCTITIRCDTILDNMNSLDEAKHILVPPDGIILSQRKVEFDEGENVFDVLLKETRNNKIHMEFVKSPVYDSAYIEGIHNLYEFDCGELSGWMYSVNGWFPNYGCSNYILNDGDNIEWVYTCNLGNDVK